MSRRLAARLAAVLVLPVTLLVAFACTPEQEAAFKAMSPAQQTAVIHAASAGQPAPAPPPPPADPCWDFHQLERGQGTPERQAWHNSLRVDGAEPDYLRYWVSCQVEHDGGPTWNRAWNGAPVSRDRRWSTSEYQCARGTLFGEHGGKAWDTDHHNGEGVNIPQAKPVSKLAGLDRRAQLRWFVDYVNGRYGGPTHLPNGCGRAGY